MFVQNCALINRFGAQISFWQPRDRSKSDIIFYTDIPKGHLVEFGVRLAAEQTAFTVTGDCTPNEEEEPVEPEIPLIDR